MVIFFGHGGAAHDSPLKSSEHFLQEPAVAITVATIAVGLLAVIVISTLSKHQVSTSETQEPGQKKSRKGKLHNE